MCYIILFTFDGAVCATHGGSAPEATYSMCYIILFRAWCDGAVCATCGGSAPEAGPRVLHSALLAAPLRQVRSPGRVHSSRAGYQVELYV